MKNAPATTTRLFSPSSAPAPRPRIARIAAAHAIVALGAAGFMPVHAAEPAMLVSAASDRCLDVARGSQEPRTPAIIWDCHGGPNQAW